MKFAIRLDPVWRPLLLVGGATRENSYVELTDAGARFRFGLLFDRLVPYSDIKAVFLVAGPSSTASAGAATCAASSARRLLPRRRRGPPQAEIAPRLGRLPVGPHRRLLEEPSASSTNWSSARLVEPPVHNERGHTARPGSRAASTRKRTRKREGA